MRVENPVASFHHNPPSPLHSRLTPGNEVADNLNGLWETDCPHSWSEGLFMGGRGSRMGERTR